MTIQRLDEVVARVKQLARGIITQAELRAMLGDEEFLVAAVLAAAVGEELDAAVVGEAGPWWC